MKRPTCQEAAGHSQSPCPKPLGCTASWPRSQGLCSPRVFPPACTLDAASDSASEDVLSPAPGQLSWPCQRLLPGFLSLKPPGQSPIVLTVVISARDSGKSLERQSLPINMPLGTNGAQLLIKPGPRPLPASAYRDS